MRKVLITHTDLDGIGNIIIAKEFKLHFDNILIVNYEDLETEKFYDTLNLFDEIIITDLFISEKLYNYLKSLNKKFMIFDHHQETQNLYEKYPENIIFNINKSGTKLFFEYISKQYRVINIVKEFVELVDVYDLWRLEHPLRQKAKQLNNLMYQMLAYHLEGYKKYENFINSQLQKFDVLEKDNFYFTDYEKLLIKDAEIKEKLEIKKAEKKIQVRKDSKGKIFGLFEASSKISNTCSYFLERYKKLDYIICVNTFGGYNGKISVRSQEHFNVNNLKNVDGHKQAGGGNLGEQKVKELLSGKIKELGYKDELER